MTFTTPKLNDIIRGKVTTLAFGGSGLLRKDNFVVFIPFTAPEDEVTCSLNEIKKGYAKGVVQEIVKPSPLRTLPKCPYFEKCGGCQLQHIEYEAQSRYKKLQVHDSLVRIGKLEFPPVEMVAADHPYFYRERVTLHITADDTSYKIGYIGEDNASLIEINTCPIFHEFDKPIIAQLRELIHELHFIRHNKGRAQILKDKMGGFIIHVQLAKLPLNTSQILEKAKGFPLISGIEFSSSVQSKSIGLKHIESQINGLTIQYTPKVFIQNNFSQSLKIYAELLEIAKQIKPACALDLYCGIGISSLLLLKENIPVFAIEINPYAIDLAKRNATLNNWKNYTFLQANVEDALAEVLKKQKYELIIINPPRQGLKSEVIDQIKLNPPDHLIYISCMPATLARDLSLFENTYKINKVKAFDMFPQTGHIETLIHLEKK